MFHPTARRAFPLLAIALLPLAGCSASGTAVENTPPTITAKGVGRVTGTPDTVILTIGVESQGPDASAALTSNNEKTTSVINLLKGAGVPAGDIQTSQFSINPRYNDEGTTITGYSVSNLLTARVAIDKDAGAIIDTAAGSAGNDIRVQSVSFEIDDKGPLYESARKDAVERAKEQAEQLADAAGVDLGDVRSITESTTAETPPIPFGVRADAANSVPLEPGSQEITLEVEVIYEID